MLLRNIKPCPGHVNGNRYVVDNMTHNMLFLTSMSGSKTGKRLMLLQMNCTVFKGDLPITGFRRSQISAQICFAMTINKAQGQSIHGTLGIDLHGQCFNNAQLYVALSSAANPWNVFILTTDSSTRTENVVFSELFVVSHNIHRVCKSVIPKYTTPKLGMLLDIYCKLAESGKWITDSNSESAWWTKWGRLSEDVISISDADSKVFQLAKDWCSTIANPNISEFQCLCGLIPD